MTIFHLPAKLQEITGVKFLSSVASFLIHKITPENPQLENIFESSRWYKAPQVGTVDRINFHTDDSDQIPFLSDSSPSWALQFYLRFIARPRWLNLPLSRSGRPTLMGIYCKWKKQFEEALCRILSEQWIRDVIELNIQVEFWWADRERVKTSGA